MQRLFIAFQSCLLLLALGGLYGQESAGALDRYIREGIEQNLGLKNHRLEIADRMARIREAKGMFYPQVSLEASYTRAGGGRAIQIPVGDLLNPVYSTLNAITGEDNFPQIENVNELFLPNNFHETKLRLIQPVYQPRLFINRNLQEAGGEMARVESEVYRKELIREIRTAYFQYLQTLEGEKIYHETGGLLREALRVNRRLVEQDKATYEAVYQAEYELLKNTEEQASMVARRATAQAYFNFLLNREADAVIEVDSTLDLSTETASLESLYTEAVQQRTELQTLETAREINALQTSLTRANTLPNINAVVDAGYQGFGYKFNEDQDFWLGQISLSWNLFQGFQNKARLQQNRIQREIIENEEQQLKRQLALQARQAWYELQAAQKRLEAARASVEAARSSFRIINRKYEANQASWLAWTQARTALTTARLSLSNAKHAFLSQQARLQWAVGRDYQ